MSSRNNDEVKISPHDPQRGMGDNGGPKLQKFTAKHKVERIKEVLDMEISAAQKCVGIGVICEADTDWITPELSAAQLQRYASVKDPETVYRATKRLATEKVVNPLRVEGRANRYVVLPSEAIDAALDEIDALTTPVSSESTPPIISDGSSPPQPLRLDRSTPSDQTGEVRSEPVRTERTPPIETDTPAPPPTRARAELNNINKINTYPTDRGEEKDRGCGGKEKPKLDLEAEDSEPKASPLEAFNLYNETALRAGIPQAATLTPQRRKSIAARMREHGGIEAWKRALANIERSAFLQGSNDRGWRADLDFLLQAKSFTKVVEGSYGNGAHGPAPGPQKPKVTDRDRIAQIARELDEKERQKAPSWKVPHEH